MKLGFWLSQAKLCNIFNEICNKAKRSKRRGVRLPVSQFNVAIIFVAAIKVDATQKKRERERQR